MTYLRLQYLSISPKYTFHLYYCLFSFSNEHIGYYILLIFLKTATQGFTTACMTHINYPAKVLFKSANPIVTMLIGLLWFRKTYAVRDYVVVALLVLGLYVFMNGDTNASPKGTRYGIFLVVLSMFGSAGVPMVQEHVMHKYNATIEELLYHCYLGSTVISFLLAFLSGEFFEGITFLMLNSSVSTWISFIAFCSFGYCGANFGAALTQHFGSLVNGITNTARKAVTLGKIHTSYLLLLLLSIHCLCSSFFTNPWEAHNYL